MADLGVEVGATAGAAATAGDEAGPAQVAEDRLEELRRHSRPPRELVGGVRPVRRGVLGEDEEGTDPLDGLGLPAGIVANAPISAGTTTVT